MQRFHWQQLQYREDEDSQRAGEERENKDGEGKHRRPWHLSTQGQVQTDQNQAGSVGDLQGGDQEPEEHSPEERTRSEERTNI